MSDPRAELATLATLANQQGRTKIEAVCRLALARLEELDAEILMLHRRLSSGGLARAESLTAEQRRDIASSASKQRWQRRRAS